jgi:3-oxoacyl-[acyl-carrier protein] reductase
MKSLLITGSSGGIGSSIVKLYKDTYEISEIKRNDIDLGKIITENICFENEYDTFIYCAGVNYPEPFKNLSFEKFEEIMNVNLISFLKILHSIKIKSGGSVVVIGSLFSFQTRKFRSLYTISKHGLLGAVKSLSLELAEKSVRINMVSPGYVKTEMTTKNNTTDQMSKILNHIPLHRFVTSEEVADLCYFLTEKGLIITGQNFIIDGGVSNAMYEY